MGQQMEHSFPLGIFRKKRNSFRRSPLFVFTEMTGILLNHLPWSHSHTMLLVEIAVYFPKLPVERTVPFDSTMEQLFFPYSLFHLVENCQRFFHINGKHSRRGGWDWIFLIFRPKLKHQDILFHEEKYMYCKLNTQEHAPLPPPPLLS